MAKVSLGAIYDRFGLKVGTTLGTIASTAAAVFLCFAATDWGPILACVFFAFATCMGLSLIHIYLLPVPQPRRNRALRNHPLHVSGAVGGFSRPWQAGFLRERTWLRVEARRVFRPFGREPVFSHPYGGHGVRDSYRYSDRALLRTWIRRACVLPNSVPNCDRRVFAADAFRRRLVFRSVRFSDVWLRGA